MASTPSVPFTSGRAQARPYDSPLLHANRITCRVNGHDLISNVSVSLHRGEVVGLIGPNGAGKSTLIRALCGLIPVTEGTITLDNRPLREWTPRQIAQRIALLPQSATLDAAFTVREVVLMGRNPYLGRFQVEGERDREIAEDAMRVTDTLAFAKRLIQTLSGGERQRVFLARALTQTPSILLLDEPIANLDVRHELDLLTLTQRLARERSLAVLIALHDLSLAARYGDRLLLLYRGQTLAEGTAEQVLTPETLARAFQVDARLYADPFTHQLQLSINTFKGRSEIDNE